LEFQIIVPASEVTVPNDLSGENPMGSNPDIVWIPPAPIGFATYFTILFSTPAARDAIVPGWPGRNEMGTELVARIGLRNRETVWLVVHEQRMSESQKATLAQRRVEIARFAQSKGYPPGELRALYFGRENGVAFYAEVSDKGLPLASERW
jgi:hypothetical protein